MISRRVTKTKKNSDGDILALCKDYEDWSPRKNVDAISDIENSYYSYYVIGDRERVDIHVVNGSNGKYLRTDPDKTINNNLDELPNC